MDSTVTDGSSIELFYGLTFDGPTIQLPLQVWQLVMFSICGCLLDARLPSVNQLARTALNMHVHPIQITVEQQPIKYTPVVQPLSALPAQIYNSRIEF